MDNKYSAEELQSWLLEKASEASNPNYARKLIMSDNRSHRDTSMIGRMYFFKYDPKGKYYLPKYDKFPLVIPLERYGGSFLGLNLHYLSGGARSTMLTILMEFANNNKMDGSTRMLLSYNIMKSTSTLDTLSQQCIKKYLFNNVRSKFIEIYPTEYNKAIQLPVENWVIRS
jgi:hypothetical protein